MAGRPVSNTSIIIFLEERNLGGGVHRLISALIVLDDKGEIQGIISERDIIRKLEKTYLTQVKLGI